MSAAERSCISCGSILKKDELLKFVMDIDGNGIVFDFKSSLPGRGAYVCPTKVCLSKAVSRNKFAKHFKCEAGDLKVDLKQTSAFIASIYESYIFTLIRVGIGGRKIVEGLENVLHSDSVSLLLLAKDAGNDSVSKAVKYCNVKGIKLIRFSTKMKIAEAIGKPLRSTYGVNDEQLGNTIYNKAVFLDEVESWLA